MATAASAPEPVVGNAYDLSAPRPVRVDARRRSRPYAAPTSSEGPSGPTNARVYATMKDMECREFERRISMLEYETYL